MKALATFFPIHFSLPREHVHTLNKFRLTWSALIPEGRNSVRFPYQTRESSAPASGVDFYQLEPGTFPATTSMMITK